MSSRHVVYVAESFSAGTLTVVRVMANTMRARGWSVTVVHGRREDTPLDVQALFADGVRLVELAWPKSVRPDRQLTVMLQLRSLLRRLDPTAIHLVSSRAGFVGRLAAWPSLSRRVVFAPQGWSFLMVELGPVARAIFATLEWFAARLGGTIQTCSQSERDAGSFVASRSRFVTIENALLPSANGTENVSPRREATPHTVGTVGRVAAQKDPAFFAAVAALVARRAPDVHFVWLGDGDRRHELEQFTTPRIAVTGWMPAARVGETMKEWTLYLQTSVFEGMPLSVMEAMARGLPVVARDAIGTRDIIRDGQTGVLVSSPAEAADAVVRLLNSPDERARLGNAARAEAQLRFSPTRLGDELELLYGAISNV